MRDVSMAAQKRDFAALGVDFRSLERRKRRRSADPGHGQGSRRQGPARRRPGRAHRARRRPGETKKKKLDDGTVVEVESPDPLLVVSSRRLGHVRHDRSRHDRASACAIHSPISFSTSSISARPTTSSRSIRAAAKAGYTTRDALEHIGFGTMNGADGKPFKTRAGGVLKLHDLIGQAEEKARERLREARHRRRFLAGRIRGRRPQGRRSPRSSSPTSPTSAARPTCSISTAS